MEKRLLRSVPVVFAVSLGLFIGLALSGRPLGSPVLAEESRDEKAVAVDNPPPREAEARVRAKILHETIHGTLQVMHRDFFDEDASLIPSQSLEDVFHELKRGHQVELRWLTVNTDVLNTDHEPSDAFENDAVEALREGKDAYEATEGMMYRYAGAIRLSSQCLKCHVKRRSSNQDRVAGLLITMPLAE